MKGIRVSFPIPRASQGVGVIRAKLAETAVAGTGDRLPPVTPVVPAPSRKNTVEGQAVTRPRVAVGLVMAARHSFAHVVCGRGTLMAKAKASRQLAKPRA